MFDFQFEVVNLCEHKLFSFRRVDDDVFRVSEGLTAAVFKQCIGVEIPLPLPRLKYADVMLRYGSDKSDLRYGLEIVGAASRSERPAAVAAIVRWSTTSASSR